MARPIITLTTDYGTSDHLVGAMKGVILNINPEVQVVDITHSVLAHDLLDGTLTIGQSAKFFPAKTVHVVVVDPGVGTARRPILVAGDQQYYVAPDNGVLSSIYSQSETLTAWHITAEHYFRQPLSNTFHGRDIFAPVAAWLTKSWQTSAFGEEITDFVRFNIPKPKVSENTIKGVVLRVDTFGNLITNLNVEEFPLLASPECQIRVQTGKGSVTKLASTFADGPAGEPVAIVGSSGYLEIAVNKGNAAQMLGVVRGAEVTAQIG